MFPITVTSPDAPSLSTTLLVPLSKSRLPFTMISASGNVIACVAPEVSPELIKLRLEKVVANNGSIS